MRTGTVATIDNRNWELRYDELVQRLSQSRAIALDMESATIAANGFRFRVPYGTLLCVSDSPLHGELKLRGMANQFYRERINQHLLIGLEAVRILREEGAERLHSRKLRSFDEPAFRQDRAGRHAGDPTARGSRDPARGREACAPGVKRGGFVGRLPVVLRP